jgi:hypothetical protein
MRTLPHFGGADLGRRRFLLGSGAAAAAASLAGARAALADDDGDEPEGRLPTGPAPDPIPGGTPIGLPPPFDLIHLFTPGPLGVTLPFSGIPLEGLNVEPSTLTNFSGATALAYLAGSARGNDGVEYGLEVDLRVSEVALRPRPGARAHHGQRAGVQLPHSERHLGARLRRARGGTQRFVRLESGP